ncbi:hypothetical protein HYDPIDRAFT_25491 [Hydnomerulius pinastri MD-312]|nr:hypothetical protein HYDPIDRAFT_25491 [Hydnomerulius pinastri MD-312]
MPSATGSTLEFSCIQATEVSRYQELRVQVSLDGTIQESQESTLDAGVHKWQEPFSFDANSNSQCEIHVLAEKRKFFCCARRYKAVRKTRLQSVGELLDTRSSNGEVQLPLYDSARTDGNGVVMGNVIFIITDTNSCRASGIEGSLRVPSLETPSEKLSIVESESEVSETASRPPRPEAPTPPTSPPSASPSYCPPYVPSQPPPLGVPSHNVFTPQFPVIYPIAFTSQPTSQLPQSDSVYPPPESGVDRPLAEIGTYGDAGVLPKTILSPRRSSGEGVMAAPSLICEERTPGFTPRGPAEIGSFTPILCEAPEEMPSEGSAQPWLSVAPHTTGPTTQILLTSPEVSEPTTLPQISITLARTSRSSSPLSLSCESDATYKRPNVHVNTGSPVQGLNVKATLSPGAAEPSPFSRSAVSASSQPTTSTTNTSSSGLSPFSRSPLADSPGTDATSPSAHSVASECAKDGLMSPPGSPGKLNRKRPTIDTSCVGPRGQVKKYRNGSVPPVNVPVKLRNASLDLPRHDEYERYEPNPSMYSIAPSVSPRHFRSRGDITCPSSQAPASRQGFVSNSHAPSIRREPLEYDEGQICLDTANLGDQEVATFLKEVDAALSAVINGSPAVASDGRAFLSVPSAIRGPASRQSRKPSSQQLRADLSATVRGRDDKEGAARTGFSLVATSHPSPHPGVIPSRVASPLSGQADAAPRLFVSQVEITTSSKPASPSRGIRVPSFPAPQHMSPQPSSRQEWSPPALLPSVSSRTKEPMQLAPAVDHTNGDVHGNEVEGARVEYVLGRPT